MIIGVDPGTTTGFVFWSPDLQNFVTKAQAPAFDAVAMIWAVIDDCKNYPGLTVVCERYDITSGTVRVARNRDPYHVEGALRFRCELRDVRFEQVSRAEAKRFAHDQRLQRLGYYERGGEHARDAVRQVVTFLAQTDDSYRRHIVEVERGDG